jgi:hypothetical protein
VRNMRFFAAKAEHNASLPREETARFFSLISLLFVHRSVTRSHYFPFAASSLLPDTYRSPFRRSDLAKKKYRTSKGLIRTRQIWTKLWMEQFPEASFRALQGTHQLSSQDPNPESSLISASTPAEVTFFATHSPVFVCFLFVSSYCIRPLCDHGIYTNPNPRLPA